MVCLLDDIINRKAKPGLLACRLCASHIIDIVSTSDTYSDTPRAESWQHAIVRGGLSAVHTIAYATSTSNVETVPCIRHPHSSNLYGFLSFFRLTRILAFFLSTRSNLPWCPHFYGLATLRDRYDAPYSSLSKASKQAYRDSRSERDTIGHHY